MHITPKLIDACVHCELKGSLRANNTEGRQSAYEQLSDDLESKYHEQAINYLLTGIDASQVRRSPDCLHSLKCDGWQLALAVEGRNGRYDWVFPAIGRAIGDNGGSRFLPYLFTQANKLSWQTKVVAACHGLVLGELLAMQLDHVSIVHGPEFSIARVKLIRDGGPTKIAAEAGRLLAFAAQLTNAAIPPPKLVLNKHCQLCEFRDRCQTEAEKSDDLSLLRSIRPAEIEAFNNRGIFSVKQLAYAFRPKTVGRAGRQVKKHSLPLQAMSIRDKTVYVRRAPEIPSSTTRAFLDVEGLPDTDSYYLAGLLVEDVDKCVRHQFWADVHNGEATLWTSLAAKLNELNCAVFHFGRYETEFMRCMEQRYGRQGLTPTDAGGPKLFDVYGAIRANVYFPTYSNSLKSVAHILGVTWSGALESGLDTIVWRTRWEIDGDPELKADLLRYNFEDCKALKAIVEYLAGLSAESEHGSVTVTTSDKLPKPAAGNFGPTQSALPHFDDIVKHAYFNYQRNKVFLRRQKPSGRRRTKASSRSMQMRINERIDCAAPKQCPACGHEKVWGRKMVGQKAIKDIKFSRTGAKRWVIQYSTGRYHCRSCRASFYSLEYPTKQVKFGHGLASWAVYQHVALRQSFEGVAESINDVFGYGVGPRLVEAARHVLYGYYRATEAGLLAKLRQGNLICADEAKIDIKGGKTGYVWTFSNADLVLYRFSESRDGDLLHEVLGDFQGVLVSDFYAAYESVTCKQQKCLY